ncbi:iron-siderophore ABC transporter substrate-binding protein [Paenibacillus antri]|uniref:Iron-siderophore ABC transporter substrate-binding protein n=1 Tax=Paenibacillus antri TaxID=2582848 RepID=A0A5R9GB84_9BACL|nr:iron-siderophore ABC transporter substrate-binding protein [Paenibacillus antri]TLS51350.1 iron-siderophore ABC transporter substrate-binding protein [Paenibacillus antri]
MKKLSNIALTSIALLALAFGLAACGGTDSQQPAAETSDSTEAANDNGAATSEAAPEAEPATRSFTHAMGTTDVPTNPQRVVILTNEGTEALLALGVTPVGAAKSWLGDPWYDHIKDQMKDVVNVGEESQPNLELIIGLKPDLIIGNKMRNEEIYDELSAIAPTVFAETLRGDWQVNFKMYADVLGKTAEGEKVMGDYEARIADLKTKLGDKLSTQVSIVRFMANDTRIYWKDTFSGVILSQIGLARPPAQDIDDFAARGVTKERIEEMDGDILFYFSYELGDGGATAVEDSWLKDPLWQTLDVVKAGKAYKVSDAIWNTAGGVIAANLMIDDLYTYFEVK